MASYTIRTALFCDFIRAELQNKFTIIGAFAGDILVESLPATFHVAAYLEIEGIALGTHKVAFEMNFPGTSYRFDADMDVVGPYGSFPLPQVTVTAVETGDAEIRIKLNDEDWVVALGRKIILAGQPKA